jgi:hypothetical protein
VANITAPVPRSRPLIDFISDFSKLMDGSRDPCAPAFDVDTSLTRERTALERIRSCTYDMRKTFYPMITII